MYNYVCVYIYIYIYIYMYTVHIEDEWLRRVAGAAGEDVAEGRLDPGGAPLQLLVLCNIYT